MQRYIQTATPCLVSLFMTPLFFKKKILIILIIFSFVDCPGHDILMSTMLSGAAVMDAALLLIAGNETVPQPQTSEHLAAIEIMKLDKIIILQNKVDLMREEAAQQHYQSILKFVRGTPAAKSPIIPISAQLKFNIDAINEAIVCLVWHLVPSFR